MEVDAQINKVVVRDMTSSETEQRAKDLAKHAALAEAKLERAAARQAVLDKLGLTADEAAALFG